MWLLTWQQTLLSPLSLYFRLGDTPYILGNATPGGWGGMVYQSDSRQAARLLDVPSTPALSQLGASPASDPYGEIQPPGCAARTFTGTSFDLSEITLEVVRTAAGLWPVEGGYPETPWQLGICNLRDDQGTRSLPNWRSFEIHQQEQDAIADERNSSLDFRR